MMLVGLAVLIVVFPSFKHVCRYSWENRSFQEEFAYGELCLRVSSAVQREIQKDIFPDISSIPVNLASWEVP